MEVRCSARISESWSHRQTLATCATLLWEATRQPFTDVPGTPKTSTPGSSAHPTTRPRFVRALGAFGFAFLGLAEADFLAHDQIIQLGYPLKGIDLLTSLSGVEFAACYPARVEVEIAGVAVAFIDLQNRKKNRLASARRRDLADLENLK
jgi:hypothetical protein